LIFVLRDSSSFFFCGVDCADDGFSFGTFGRPADGERAILLKR
jgi:hypothetical protein